VKVKTCQLNHVALVVEDVERSVKFYAETLDLEPIERPAFNFPGAWFRLGVDQELHLIGGRDRDVHAGTRDNHFALRVESMDDTETALKAKGVEYTPRRTRPDGAFQIYVFDPDGHCIELCQV